MSANLYQTIRRPIGPSQTVSYTGTAGGTTGMPPYTAAVWVYTTTAAYLRITVGSAAVDATTTDFPVPANVPVVLPVEKPTNAGTAEKVFVSAIQASAGGSLLCQGLAE